MEGLIKLLVEINKAIGLPSADELSFAKDGVATIAKFYALTFFFLGEFMDWYVRKATCRLLKTRSLDAYSDFQTVVCCIKGTARGMDIGRMDLDPECEGYRKAMKQNTSHLWEEARLSQVGLQGYTRRYASQNAMTRHLMWEMQHDATQRVRLKMESNLYLSQMISLANRQLLPVPGPDGGAACLLATQPHDLGR